MSPEEEAKRIEQQIRAAQTTGDVATILRLISQTSELTPQDFIKKTLGNLMYIYYLYLSEFHVRPKDLEDMVDGLLFIDARNFLDKKFIDEARSKK